MRIRDYSSKNFFYKIGPTPHQDIIKLLANHTQINCSAMNSTTVDLERKMEGVYFPLVAAFIILPTFIGCCCLICCFVRKQDHNDTSSEASLEPSTVDNTTCELAFASTESTFETLTLPQFPSQVQTQANAVERSSVKLLETAGEQFCFFTQKSQQKATGTRSMGYRNRHVLEMDFKLLKKLQPNLKLNEIVIV